MSPFRCRELEPDGTIYLLRKDICHRLDMLFRGRCFQVRWWLKVLSFLSSFSESPPAWRLEHTNLAGSRPWVPRKCVAPSGFVPSPRCWLAGPRRRQRGAAPALSPFLSLPFSRRMERWFIREDEFKLTANVTRADADRRQENRVNGPSVGGTQDEMSRGTGVMATGPSGSPIFDYLQLLWSKAVTSW